METGLQGKNALITGGSSGIGKGISKVLASEGVNIAIASRNPDINTIEEIKEMGVSAYAISADVSCEAQVVNMVNKSKDMLGSIDFYINNAAWTWHQPITKIDSESWYKTINTNLSACIWACREVSKSMIENAGGSIVIIGSTVRFNPVYLEASYRISKMGLYMYMQTLAIEMAPFGIRVNMVTPGHYKTRMTGEISDDNEKCLKRIIPAHRFGKPDEIGNAVAFLLSDKLSGYTFGSDVVVDGGLSLNPLNKKNDKELKKLNL